MVCFKNKLTAPGTVMYTDSPSTLEFRTSGFQVGTQTWQFRKLMRPRLKIKNNYNNFNINNNWGKTSMAEYRRSHVCETLKRSTKHTNLGRKGGMYTLMQKISLKEETCRSNEMYILWGNSGQMSAWRECKTGRDFMDNSLGFLECED